jgi:SOS-response transcriptional repressor LexA
MEPIYSEGDLLVCAPNLQLSQGDLVVAKTMDDETFFKKYQQRGTTTLLLSYNPKHPAMEFKPGELRKIHVVHSVIRPLKGKIF